MVTFLILVQQALNTIDTIGGRDDEGRGRMMVRRGGRVQVQHLFLQLTL